MQTTEENVTTMLPVDTESSWWAWAVEAMIEGFALDPDEGFSESEAAVTVSFLTLAFGQLWHVVAMWQPESGVFSNEVTRNRYVWAAVGGCVLLLFGTVYIPGVGPVLEMQPPSAEAWGLIALMRLVPLGVGQVVLLVRRCLRTFGEKGTALG